MRVVTLKDGRDMYVHDQDEAVSDRIVADEDYYELEILQYLSKNFHTQDVILDIGANIGNHTVYFARNFLYSQIIAFEPVPQNYDLLSRNTSDLLDVSIRNQAVGDGDLDVKVLINPENMGACEISPVGDVKVHQIKLDNLIVNPVTLIKIDVEWYEPFVLLGAKNLLEQDKPLILIEDTHNEYGKLLPGYTLLKSWPVYNTHLYGVW